MIFPTPDGASIAGTLPPAAPGDFSTINISDSNTAATFSLEHTEPGIVRNGNHFFYSGFLKASSIAAHAELDKKLVLLYDPDIYIALTLSFDANGRLSESPSSNNVVTFRAVNGGSLSDKRDFHLASSSGASTINRRINYDAKGWLWFAWYYEYGNETSFRGYFNGVQLQEVGHNATGAESGAVTDSTFQVYGLTRSDTSLTSSQDFSDEWFGTALDGSVIGQPEFLDEFVNPDGTAKRLGNGTVSTIVPHSYFSSETAPNVNEVDLTVWAPAASNTANVELSASDGEVKWYGDSTRSYIFQRDAISVIHTVKPSPVTVGDKIFTSFFVRNQSMGIPNLHRFTVDESQTRFIIDFRAFFNDNPIFFFLDHLLHATDARIEYFNDANVFNDGAWQYGSIYVEFSTNTVVFTRNGVAQVLRSETSTASSTTRDQTYLQMDGRVGILELSNFILYDEATINANLGIDWDSVDMWENFMDEATGRPLDIGFDGIAALGVKPHTYLNGATKLGFNGNSALPETLINQTADFSNVVLMDTLSAEEDIIVALP